MKKPRKAGPMTEMPGIAAPDSHSDRKTPVVVVGGGLAGISAAYHLPYPTILCERENEVGGTARTYQVNGFTFDHTGHLLHLHESYTERLVRRLLKGNLFECKRNAWIYSQNVYTRYPYQANLYGLPSKTVEECFLGLWKSKRRFGADPVRDDHTLNFREWSDRLFGEGISKHFMLPYNEKLWSVAPEDMSPDWCGSFVPQPKLEDVLVGSLSDHTKAFGYNTTFLYPQRGGIQTLAQAFARDLPDVRLGVSLEKINWKDRKAKFTSGDWISYLHMISTIPLPELLKRLDPFPPELREAADKLRWTSVLCLNLGVKRANISDKSWIYFPENKYVFYRVGFPMNFTPHAVPEGCSSMYVEVSHRPTESLDNASVLRKVRAGLEECGILKRGDQFAVASFLPIKYAYVIYDDHRSAALEKIFFWLREHAGISSIGRYGAWKYSFMEEAILDGKKTAESLKQGLVL